MTGNLRRPPRGPPLIMGVLNATPDSFSDGGRWLDPGDAVAHALSMVEGGADVIDVGGESTRPGSEPVSSEEELARLEPILRDLVPSVDVPVSVDTMKADVAARCIDLGVSVVNDVAGLRGPGMLELCASADVDVIIMHMHGEPRSMPAAMGDGFMEEIRGFLAGRAEAALEAGVRGDRIWMDPGIGFGKDPAQNEAILRSSSYFSLGYPVLSAFSRKRFLLSMFPGMDRDEATARAAVIAAESGADMVRVHDVARVRDALRGI